MNWTPGEGRKVNTEEELVLDHLRRPVKIVTDVGGCFQCGIEQG